VGLELGPLSLVSTTEELLGRKSIGSSLESREYGQRDPSRSGRSVDIVRWRTQATNFFTVLIIWPWIIFTLGQTVQ
jgi:hypothetical protein